MSAFSSRLGVAVSPSWTAGEKYSRMPRQLLSSLAPPRWHSSMTMKSFALGLGHAVDIPDETTAAIVLGQDPTRSALEALGLEASASAASRPMRSCCRRVDLSGGNCWIARLLRGSLEKDLSSSCQWKEQRAGVAR